MSASSWSRRFAFLGSTAVGTLLLWAPVFRSVDATGWGDWQWFHHMWEVGYAEIVQHGQWPLWDPYHCGGVPLWGQPQNQLYSPWFLVFGLLLGPTVGIKVTLVLHAWIGMTGIYVFARRRGRFGMPAAALAAVAWTMSGVFAWDGAGGHATFQPFYYTPWLLLFWRQAEHSRRYAGAVAAILVLTLLEGGTYAFPYFGILLALDVILRAPDRSRWTGILRSAVIVGVLTLTAGAMRWLPVFLTLREHPRLVPASDSMTLPEVLRALTDPEDTWAFPPHEFVWPEYDAYVGWVVVLLAGLGSLVAVRRQRSLLIGATVFALLMMGNFSSWAPWTLLHELPIFRSLRVPSRFSVLVLFFAALLAGLAVDALDRALRKPSYLSPGIGWLVVILVAVNLLVVHWPTIDRWNQPPIAGEMADRFHLVAPTGYGALYAHLPRRNQGTTGCYDPLDWPVASGLWFGDVPQLRCDRCILHEARYTPHVIAFEITVSEPTRVTMNQNFHPHWHSQPGTPLEDDRGRLAIELPPGRHRVQVTYRPPELVPVTVVSLIGLASVLGLILGWTRTRLRQ